jgi:hypothetical protein
VQLLAQLLAQLLVLLVQLVQLVAQLLVHVSFSHAQYVLLILDAVRAEIVPPDIVQVLLGGYDEHFVLKYNLLHDYLFEIVQADIINQDRGHVTHLKWEADMTLCNLLVNQYLSSDYVI